MKIHPAPSVDCRVVPVRAYCAVWGIKGSGQGETNVIAMLWLNLPNVSSQSH
jgi:hypothetical protein